MRVVGVASGQQAVGSVWGPAIKDRGSDITQYVSRFTFHVSRARLAPWRAFADNSGMSYTAKRLILLLMAWGLIVFTGMQVRANLTAAPPGAPAPAADP